MTYADITTRDRNPFKRWVHQRRFKDALDVLESCLPGTFARVLDYGAGNGEFIRRARAVRSFDACLYEPTLDLRAEARENLEGLDRVTLVEDLALLGEARFDLIFCLEVLEHLPEAELHRCLADLDRLLEAGGRLLIGVPHELFLPAGLKGLFRMGRRFGQFDAVPANVLSALFGRPPSRRPAAEISPGFQYHFHHLGFDYRTLHRRLAERFDVVERWFSPVPFLGAALNSEVYFLLSKRQTE